MYFLECDYHFNDVSTIKGLDPHDITQAIGTILHKNNVVKYCTIDAAKMWNIAWKEVSNLFKIENDDNLKVLHNIQSLIAIL